LRDINTVSQETVGRGRKGQRNMRNYGGREFNNVLTDLKQRQKRVIHIIFRHVLKYKGFS